MVKMPKIPRFKPSWWEKTNIQEKYFTRSYTTARGTERTLYYKEGRLYNNNQWKREYGREVFMNQLRGYAQKQNITNFREAQSRFSQVRREYIQAKREKEKELINKTGDSDAKLKDNELAELWNKYAYEE